MTRHLLNGRGSGMVYATMGMLFRGAGIMAVSAVFAATVSAVTTPPAFDRYQVILTRKPFGAAPPPPPMVKPPPPKADSFAKSLRLSMIIETDDGSMRVGFVDNRSGRSYMLRAGDAEDGIELISASFDDEEAILRNGDEMALLKLTSGEFTEIAPSEQQGRIEAARNRPSYAERRRQRMEQVQQEQKPIEPKYTGEELTKHLHEYQMEVIRQGLPPLPIPLTPEQDAQLVAEGYLPPVD